MTQKNLQSVGKQSDNNNNNNNNDDDDDDDDSVIERFMFEFSQKCSFLACFILFDVNFQARLYNTNINSNRNNFTALFLALSLELHLKLTNNHAVHIQFHDKNQVIMNTTLNYLTNIF